MPQKGRRVIGALVALAGIAALTAVMLPARAHLSLATPALVLVIPVVAGVAVGGFVAGVVAAAAGFVAYDVVFIPPYGTLTVGAAQNWLALVVYVAVMLVVARVVASLQGARAEARRREEDTRRLYLLSDLLIGDRPFPELLEQMVSTLMATFGPRWVVVLLPGDGGDAGDLHIAATAGEPLSEEDRRLVTPAGGRRQAVGAGDPAAEITQVVLMATGRPVGLLAMAGVALGHHDRELLGTYANQAALALERSQLHQQVVHQELLEEVDRWRDALMGAVSHDLRTPLASVTAAVTTLRRSGDDLSPDDRRELLELIEDQSDSLARLVTGLLDMTRIRAGALEPRPDVGTVAEVVDEAIAALGIGAKVCTRLSPGLPLVRVDQVLMVRALANLLENAERHNPEGAPVEVAAAGHGDTVEISVTDHGPGVPAAEHERIFEMFNRIGGGGRAGLGLTIARSFVEAHGQTLRVEDAPGGGARFTFTMPSADVPATVR